MNAGYVHRKVNITAEVYEALGSIVTKLTFGTFHFSGMIVLIPSRCTKPYLVTLKLCTVISKYSVVVSSCT